MNIFIINVFQPKGGSHVHPWVILSEFHFWVDIPKYIFKTIQIAVFMSKILLHSRSVFKPSYAPNVKAHPEHHL